MIRGLQFGHRYHGWVKAGQLHLADGSTRPHVQPTNGWVTVFKKPGQPAYSGSDGLLDYALISGGKLLYGKELNLPNYGAESAANCWLMASDDGNWLIAAYPQSKKLYYRQFGNLSQTDTPIDGWLSLPGYPYQYNAVREASFDGRSIVFYYGLTPRTFYTATLSTDGWLMTLSAPIRMVPDSLPEILGAANTGSMPAAGVYPYLKLVCYLGLSQVGVPMFAFVHGMASYETNTSTGSLEYIGRQEHLTVASDYLTGSALLQGDQDEETGFVPAGNCVAFYSNGQHRLVTAGGVVPGVVTALNLEASYQPMTDEVKTSNDGAVCWV
ncbi:hypothetical protein LIN78_12180 [Leeia sp. TBRC 13508]|uniref:Uncharacterized protein n=1 Tax=Leeia speluncae TaxID=2884804 RepID=A0ABS8D8G0_9NEIS|nr:hypothetical protein [Leeia speluncae]MCB6184303.1 hypothetical protein [Leeia speluncae]